MSNKSASHLSAGVKSSLLNTGHKRYYRLRILKHFFNETCQKKIIVWLGRSFSVLCRMPRLRKSYQFSQKNHSRYCWCSKHSAMWSVARPWLVPFPRRCWNWNAHLVCFWKPLWNKVSRMVKWHSSHSSWGLSLQTSLLHLVFKLLLLKSETVDLTMSTSSMELHRPIHVILAFVALIKKCLVEFHFRNAFADLSIRLLK